MRDSRLLHPDGSRELCDGARTRTQARQNPNTARGCQRADHTGHVLRRLGADRGRGVDAVGLSHRQDVDMRICACKALLRLLTRRSVADCRAPTLFTG